VSSTLWDRPLGASTKKLNPTQIKKLESIHTSKRFGFTCGSSSDPQVRLMRHVVIPTLIRHLSDPKWGFEITIAKHQSLPYPTFLKIRSDVGNYIITFAFSRWSCIFTLMKDEQTGYPEKIFSRSFSLRKVGSTKEIARFFAKRIQTEFIRDIIEM
jgi:hypothetical protein